MYRYLCLNAKKTNFLAQINKDNSNYYLGSNGKLIKAEKKYENIPFIFGKLDTKEFLNLVKRRVVWCERVDELINQLRVFLQTGVYQADVSDRSYLDAFGAHLNADEVVRRVANNLDAAIASHEREP